MAKRIIRLTESQLRQIVDGVIKEQSVAGAANNGATPTNSTDQKYSPEQIIGNNIYAAAAGAGTDEDAMLAAVEKIANQQAFFNINSYLKTLGDKLDFQDIVNDEMDNEDGKYVQRIIDHLKKIGITATATINEYGNFQPNTFKITATTPTTQTVTPRQQNINNTYCSVKNGIIVNPSSSTNNMKWDEYVAQYKPTAEELAAAKLSCPNSELAKGVIKPKFQWVKSNEQFPLKYGQYGAKIGEMQKLGLGMKGDTYFGNATEKAIKLKAPEYKRETGVTQEIYNKIVSSNAQQTPPVNTAASTNEPAPPTETELQANPNTLNPY